MLRRPRRPEGFHLHNLFRQSVAKLVLGEATVDDAIQEIKRSYFVIARDTQEIFLWRFSTLLQPYHEGGVCDDRYATIFTWLLDGNEDSVSVLAYFLGVHRSTVHKWCPKAMDALLAVLLCCLREALLADELYERLDALDKVLK